MVGITVAAITTGGGEADTADGGIRSDVVVPRPEAVEKAIAALLPDIDVLVVGGTIAGVVAKKVASSIHSVGAPVDIGLVQSLAHPGGNMTGISLEAAIEAFRKRLQLLKEIVPHLARVAVLRAPGSSGARGPSGHGTATSRCPSSS